MLAAWRPLPTINVHGPKKYRPSFAAFDLHLPRQIRTKNINVLLVFLPHWRTVLLVRPTLFSVE
jgi:hypothetical protein